MQLLLPAVVGLVTGGLFIAVFRVMSRRTPHAAPVAKPQDPDHDPFVQGSRSEKRLAPRRTGNPVAVRYQSMERRGQPVQGLVRDRSVGGLRLTVSEQFATGTVLRVLPANAPDVTPWVEVEVKTCRQTGDDFELGCQFIKQPPWSVLILFG